MVDNVQNELSECNDCIMNRIKRKQRVQFRQQHVLRMISVRRGITRGRTLGIDQIVSSLWQHYPWCLIPQYHNQCRYSVRSNWRFTRMYNNKRKCPGVSKNHFYPAVPGILLSAQNTPVAGVWLSIVIHVSEYQSFLSQILSGCVCVCFLNQNIQENERCIYSAMRSGNNVLFE